MFGVRGEDVKMKLLKEKKNLKLDRAVEICRLSETAKKEIKANEGRNGSSRQC